MAFCGTSARADVYEIDDHGAVFVRGAGAAVQWIIPDDATARPTAGALVPETAISFASASQVPEAWRAAVASAADKYRLSPDLLAALIWQESRWHPAAISPKGAMGMAQLRPATARALAIDPRDATANIAGGAQYLRLMLDRFDGDVERALAAYNAGPGRVARWGGVPRIAETRAYVSAILDRLTPAAAGETGFPK